MRKATVPERSAAEWWRPGRRPVFRAPPRVGEAGLPPQDHHDPKKKPVQRDVATPHVSRLESVAPETTVRDYYVVEDEGGRRFWVFRVGLYGAASLPRWYLHGFFA